MSPLRVLAASMAAIAALAAAFGQSNPPPPEFEVASIRPSPPQAPAQVAVGVHIDGAQVRINYFSLKDYIRIAYRVKDHQVIGPDWIASQRFDIAGKIPSGVGSDKVPEMLRALLEDRFQLKTHHDSKEFNVYGLVVAKGGLKARPMPPDPEDAERGRNVDVSATGGRGGVSINFGHGASFSLGDNKFVVKKLSMLQFADSLSRFADRPVVDMTDSPGFYEFTIEMSPEDYRAMLIRAALAAGVSLPPEAMRALEGVSGDSFFSSLQTLGLKMETRKAPLDVLVVDHAVKTPAEN